MSVLTLFPETVWRMEEDKSIRPWCLRQEGKGALGSSSVLLVPVIAEQIMANLGQHTGFVSEFLGPGISAWPKVLARARGTQGCSHGVGKSWVLI